MAQIQDLLGDMDMDLKPFESWLLAEKTGEGAYTRPMPRYELPKAEKPEARCVLDDVLTGFPRV